MGSSTASTSPAFVYVGYSIPKQEVHGLEVTGATSTSIYLKWNDWQASEDDVISGYRVRYTPLLSSLADEFKMDDGGESLEETVVTEKNEVNLVDLKKFTEYQAKTVLKTYLKAFFRFLSVVTIVLETVTQRQLVPGLLRTYLDLLVHSNSLTFFWTP